MMGIDINNGNLPLRLAQDVGTFIMAARTSNFAARSNRKVKASISSLSAWLLSRLTYVSAACWNSSGQRPA